jgi:pimeloyl-ACP methyl ester carboxylesterase
MATSSFVRVDDARVAYRVTGEGPAVVLVNGTSGVDMHWGIVIERLATQRTVVTLDYSGAGETVDDGMPLSLSMLARQVEAVAKATGCERFDVIGHSLGAAVSVFLAARSPQMVRSLVLVAGFLWGSETRLNLQFQLWRELASTNPLAFMKLLTLTALTPQFVSSFDIQTIEKMNIDLTSVINWDGLVRQVELGMKVDIREQVKAIESPTLVIGCAADQIVTQTRALAQAIAGARYEELPAGHQTYFEAGEAFVNTVTDFLNSLPI